MKPKQRKWVSLFVAILILLNTVLPSVSFADSGSEQIQDGQYDINFVVRDGDDTKNSMMDTYAEKPAKLIVENGNYKVQMTFNSADWIHAFQPQQNGQFTDATIINEDTVNNKRVYEFPVLDLTQKLRAQTHVIVPMINYDHWYEVLIVFDENDVANLPKVENGGHPGTDPGTDPGQEPGTDPIQLEENKTYTIDFTAIRSDNENASSMDGRFAKPAKLKYQNGKYYLEFALTESGKDSVTSLQFQKADGTWVNADANFAIANFETTSLTELINVKVSVEVPLPTGSVYSSTYDLRIKLDDSSIEEYIKDIQLADGEYAIDFKALHATKNEISSADKRFSKPATLLVENGKKYISFSVNDSSTITKLEIEGVEVETVSTDTTKDTRVVKFEVANLSKVITGQVFVYVPELNFTSSPNFRLVFDTTSIVSKKTVTLNEGEEYSLGTISEPTLLEINYQGNPIIITVPSGSTSIKVEQYDVQNDSVTVNISVGGLNGRKVTLILPKPTGIADDRVGAFHYNGSVWEYRAAQVQNGQVTFETNLSAVQIAEKVDVPGNLTSSVSNNQVTLSWNDVDGATYEISRIFNGQEQIVTTNLSALQYVDTVNANGQYTYKVRAVKNGYQSDWSSPKTVTVTGSSNSGGGGGWSGSPETLPTGEYSINFEVHKYGTSERSVMADYVATPAKLTKTADGKMYITLTFTNSSWIKEFEVLYNGGNTTVLYENKAANTRDVRFEIIDLNLPVDAYTKVEIPEISYFHEYNVHFVFDPNSIMSGYIPPIIAAPIQILNPVAQSPTIQLKEGEYAVNFSVYKYGTSERSVMADYVVSPAKLTKSEDGKIYITLTLKNSSWIKVFEVKSNGGNAKVVKEDPTTDMREVQFEVYDLSKKVEVYTEVDIPNINYSGKYNVEFVFDEKSITNEIKSTDESKEFSINASTGDKIEFNGVVIEIPNNALGQNFVVKIAKVANPSSLPMDPNGVLVSDVFEITKDVEGNFAKQITITLPFNKSMIDLAKYDLGIYWLDETEGQWKPLNNMKIDSENGTISGKVNHFTKFAVLAFAKEDENSSENVVHLTDIQGHWAEKVIQQLVELGAVSGYPNGEFKPDNQVTRAEFVSMVVRAFELEGSNSYVFGDTENHWAREAISIAAENNVVAGYDENTFGPDDLLTREQMVAIIVRVAQLPETSGELSFNDHDAISPWAKEVVTTAVYNNIIKGYEDNTLRPKGNATRAEVAAVIVRVLGLD